MLSTQLSIIDYSTLKAAGSIVSISLSPDGDTVTVTSKQFDSSTGAALPNLVTTWSLTDINNQIAYATAQLANFNQAVADARASAQ